MMTSQDLRNQAQQKRNEAQDLQRQVQKKLEEAVSLEQQAIAAMQQEQNTLKSRQNGSAEDFLGGIFGI